MQIPIIMPQLGESIAEARIVQFLVQPGDTVEADQDLIEVETNKATMNVTAPCGGSMVKFTAQLHESYAVGAVLGQRHGGERAGSDSAEFDYPHVREGTARKIPLDRCPHAVSTCCGRCIRWSLIWPILNLTMRRCVAWR